MNECYLVNVKGRRARPIREWLDNIIEWSKIDLWATASLWLHTTKDFGNKP